MHKRKQLLFVGVDRVECGMLFFRLAPKEKVVQSELISGLFLHRGHRVRFVVDCALHFLSR